MKDQSAELKRSNKKVGNLESELNKAKLALSVADKLKTDLVAAEQARDASYVATTQAQNEAVAAKLKGTRH